MFKSLIDDRFGCSILLKFLIHSYISHVYSYLSELLNKTIQRLRITMLDCCMLFTPLTNRFSPLQNVSTFPEMLMIIISVYISVYQHCLSTLTLFELKQMLDEQSKMINPISRSSSVELVISKLVCLSCIHT